MTDGWSVKRSQEINYDTERDEGYKGQEKSATSSDVMKWYYVHRYEIFGQYAGLHNVGLTEKKKEHQSITGPDLSICGFSTLLKDTSAHHIT